MIIFLGSTESHLNVNLVPYATCNRSTMWLSRLAGRVLAQKTRGPGFQSRSGHALFLPLRHTVMELDIGKFWESKMNWRCASCSHHGRFINIILYFLVLGSAESYLNECLSSCTTVYGPGHKKTLEVQDELARLLVRTMRESVSL